MLAANVLLVHGLGSTFQRNWERPGWVEVLGADGLTAHPVRLPGHAGASLDHTPAEAVLAAAEGVPAPRAALGFSAGGIAVLGAAAAVPDRFSRIAVLGVGDRVLAPSPDTGSRLVAALRGGTEPEDPRERVLWQLVQRSGNEPGLVADFLESAPVGVPAEALSRITCPVLVVVGAQDAAMPADALVRALPDARLEVLPGVDHFATVTSLAAMDLVTRFLAAH